MLSRLVGILLVVAVPASAQAALVDDNFKFYAAAISQSLLFRSSYRGEGVYLGQGKVLTAAHVIHSTIFGPIRVSLAGQTVSATPLRNGAAQHVDLALLSIDEMTLPVSVRLRRNALCSAEPKAGMDAVIVSSGESVASHVISPAAIAAELRAQYRTLIAMPGPSGSGLYDPAHKCLLGIMSAKMEKYSSKFNSRIGKYSGGLDNGPARIADGYAGYFVPVSVIVPFLTDQR